MFDLARDQAELEHLQHKTEQVGIFERENAIKIKTDLGKEHLLKKETESDRLLTTLNVLRKRRRE
jgi:hypothetical protein